MFERKINNEYLKLAQITYGGEFYLELNKYKQKEIILNNSKFKKVTDSFLSKRDNQNFFSYKNENTGFCANLFENKKTKELVIAYRGTERTGLGENESDFSSFMKDLKTDINLLTGNFDNQFLDAWQFYKEVKEQNPKRKIIITGQSLGGALAQIIPAKEYTINRIKIEAYSFNAPGCRHLLDVYDCNTNFDYSFITNYSVMNDWCGMFGEHIGKRYLIAPIKMKNVDTSSNTEVIYNILLTTHEGIFDYNEKINGKVIRKPKNFNQQEGLSLWYFDKNNPIQNDKNLTEFFNFNIQSLNFQESEETNDNFMKKTEKFFKENIPEEVQNSNIAVALKNVTENIKQAHLEQKEKFIESINNNPITVALKILDSITSEITEESYERAVQIQKKYWRI